jgi:hypothetical protein
MGQLGDLSPQESIAVRCLQSIILALIRLPVAYNGADTMGLLGRGDSRVDLNQSPGDRADSPAKVSPPRG